MNTTSPTAFDGLNLTRKEVSAFIQWLHSQPKNDTAFLHQTFETENVRMAKLMALYSKYKNEKRSRSDAESSSSLSADIKPV